jgi:hypothetical protein
MTGTWLALTTSCLFILLLRAYCVRGRVDVKVDTSKGNQELSLPLTGKGSKGKISLSIEVDCNN